MKRILSLPFVHFLLLGTALLIGVRFWGGGLSSESASAPSDAETIRVEAQALRDFVQGRTGVPDPAEFERQWAELSGAAQKDWLDRFVREEALVREARALGLDRDDALIRRRLVQQMEFLAVGSNPAALLPEPGALEAFFAERPADYRIPGTLRFAHVYLRADLDAHGGAPDPAATAAAVRLREELNARSASADEALDTGDRFLYQRIYVDRTVEEVESHFGSGMTQALVALEPNASRWQGPIESEHGLHLVLLSRFEPERDPALSEVEQRVTEDWRRLRREALREEAVDRVVSKYRVETD